MKTSDKKHESEIILTENQHHAVVFSPLESENVDEWLGQRKLFENPFKFSDKISEINFSNFHNLHCLAEDQHSNKEMQSLIDSETGADRIRNTLYHTQNNGVLERFHCLLKSALGSHLPDSWLDAFPLVLLGIQSSYKDDMAASFAELVYGMTPKLPGKFFSSSFTNGSTPEFLQSLRCHVSALKPIPTSCHSSCPVFISKDLFRSFGVFLLIY
ncbi:retrovirus-related Pol polyprotein from transposon opus [Nephila pilipes]|uniref:Retrovirus-related Pol polyprotein from transposon opus n=1 Tax=Nephila pilipes TaxID=299642 RepID=A0A8X6THB6_NEPPI|nr:retrovirus-related Pol polyprotein from transposon opus [Nephila pilipes]